jgi:hypothetical protein
MSVLDLLLGKPLATSAEDGERVGPAARIPLGASCGALV